MTDAKVIMVKRDCFSEKMLDYDVCTTPCTPKVKDMTKAKQLLLESSLIAKDMEILVMKEKLKELSLLQLKTNRQLAKMPNWIKWLFK